MKITLTVTYEAELTHEQAIEFKDLCDLDTDEILNQFTEVDKTLLIEGL